MKKEYQKPEIEIISLVTQENLTTLSLDPDDIIDGKMSLEEW